MEQSLSQQPPSLTPATSSSDQAEYWCYHCDTTALVETLADCSQIVCRECNSGFVESISSIAVSVSPDHFSRPQFRRILGLSAESMTGEDGDDDEFAEDNDGESEEGGDIYDENEEDGVTNDEIEEEDGESDDEYGDMDDVDDEDEEEEERNIENIYNNSTRETEITELFDRLDLDNLRIVRMSLEDNEDETDGDGRTGAPAAAESVVSSLKTVDVEVEKDVIHCAVCKDLVSVGEVAKELECGHGYHEECILPWLGLRNTCPVCRFELPTDDAEYEEKRKKELLGASASGCINSWKIQLLYCIISYHA